MFLKFLRLSRPGAIFQLNRRGATELANAGVDLLNRRLPGYHLQDVNGRSLNADQFENRSVLLPEDQGETFLQLLSDEENKGEEKKWYKYWLTNNVVERFSADKQQSQIAFRQPNQIHVTVSDDYSNPKNTKKMAVFTNNFFSRPRRLLMLQIIVYLVTNGSKFGYTV
jgi:hypothetical protein